MGHSSGGTHVGTYALHKAVQPPEGTIKGAIIMSGQCRPDVENAPGDRASPYYGADKSKFQEMSAIANACAIALWKAAPARLQIMNYLSWCCFAPFPDAM